HRSAPLHVVQYPGPRRAGTPEATILAVVAADHTRLGHHRPPGINVSLTITFGFIACLLTGCQLFIFCSDFAGMIPANKGPARTARRQDQYPLRRMMTAASRCWSPESVHVAYRVFACRP